MVAAASMAGRGGGLAGRGVQADLAGPVAGRVVRGAARTAAGPIGRAGEALEVLAVPGRLPSDSSSEPWRATPMATASSIATNCERARRRCNGSAAGREIRPDKAPAADGRSRHRRRPSEVGGVAAGNVF